MSPLLAANISHPYTIALYAITEAETTDLKAYLTAAKFDIGTFPIASIVTYLWVLLDTKNKQTLSWQNRVTDSEYNDQKIVSTYFTPSSKNIPFHVYQNPDKYPEYFL